MLRDLVSPSSDAPYPSSVRRQRDHRTRTPGRWISALVSAALVLLGAVAVAPAAQAAGDVDFAVAVNSPGESLQGAPFDVTLSATSSAPTVDGYNLTFRLQLPAEATITSSPAPVLDVVNAGVRTVIWENVSDLLEGTTSSLTVTVDPNNLPLGSLALSADAYLNTDPRLIPDHDAAGVVTGDYSANDTGAGTVTLVPFTITKATQATENELLRGVHDQRVAVNLTLRNNAIGASSAMTVTDYIPAELEFLGCGATAADGDNSATQESGTGKDLNASDFALTQPCPVPSFVDTQTLDPDGAGPLPTDVYTVVTWTTADLGAAGLLSTSEVATLQYVVGVPQYRNTDPAGFEAAFGTAGDQGSNLDNNTGATTAEGFDGSTVEQEAVNLAVLNGVYDDPFSTTPDNHTASDTDEVAIEDVAIHKSSSTGSITQGAATTWTLLVETSEYATSTSGITITDHLPDGLTVVGTAPAGATVDPAGEGTTITWTLAGPLAANSSTTLTISTTTDTAYSDGTDAGQPVRANDAWTNTVELAAASVIDLQPAVGDRNLTDDSSAGQTAGPISLKKYVAAPTAGVCDTAASLAGWQDDVWGTEFGPGDLVCWRIDITAPANLDTTNLQLTDFLPSGYTFVSSVDGAGSNVTFPTTAPGLTVAGASITWDLTGAGDLDQSNVATVIVLSRITDPSAHAPADIVENLAKLVYRNTDGETTGGEIFQLREQADAPWKEPILGLTKSASPTTVDGTSVVTYTVNVPNTGDQLAQDVSVRDVLPTGIACTDVVPASIPAGFTCEDQSPRDWLQGEIASIGAGATGSFTYQVNVPATVVPGQTLVNDAGVRTYQVATNDPANPLFPYVPSGNIDPTLTPNTTPARDTETVTVRSPVIDKTITTDVDVVGSNTLLQGTPGEIAHYTVQVTLPASTTLTGARLQDTLPSEMQLLTATVQVGANTTSVGTAALNAALVVTAGDWQLPLPTPYTVGATDETLSVTFDAQVRNTAAVDVDGSARNRGYLYWNSANVSDYVDTRIVQPNIGITKTVVDADADGRAEPDELLSYTAVVTNAGTNVAAPYTSTAYDTQVIDLVPTSMTPVDAGGLDVADGASVPSGGVWDETARTLTWTIATIAPNATVTLPYQTRVENPLPSPTTFTNAIDALTSSMPGTVAGERISTAVTDPLGRYHAEDDVTLEGPEPTVLKSVTPAWLAPGDVATYTVTAVIPPNVQTYAVVLDELPAGMAFVDGSTSSVCLSAGPCTLAATELNHAGTDLGWLIGSVVQAADERRVEITYQATVVGAGGTLVAGDDPTNLATIVFEDITPPATPPASVGDVPGLGLSGVSPVATATFEVREPSVTLTKTVAQGAAQVDFRNVRPGDALTYSITVTNANTATTSTAHDVVVRDITDPRFGTIANVTGATVVDGIATGDGGLVFSVADLAPGASATITYDVVVPAKADLPEVIGGPELTNTAVADFSSLAGAVAGERLYTSNTDTVTLEADVASLGDRVWFDLANLGVQDGSELGVVGATVTVTYLGADGVVGGGDDVAYPALTTDANGEYLQDLLPEGTFAVTVSNLPAGTALTYDEDSGTAAPDGTTLVTLSDGEYHPTADFGIRGAGTVGNLVWLDLDADGVQDSTTTEPGVAGVEVTVTWPAVDGLPAGSVTTTTAADGTWSVTGIPAVDVTVTVNPATYPAGTSLVSEPHGGAVDGAATFPLAAGATDDGYDFGLRGSALLGDRLWVDTNADGVQDAGEPGIPGAVVEVRWEGSDGVLGTADDAVQTVTSGADGLYEAPYLPAGDFRVTVVSLPTALAPTFDEDSGTTSPNGITTVALAAGEQHRTADFGYVAATGVGDRLWLDADADGVQDPGEPGLAGVEVTVTSAGTDGVLGTADDIVRTTTTAADGQWLVTGLPAGPTRVEVTGTLPGGLTPTFDADGGLDGVSELVLVSGVTDLDQDFGYVGPNSIGDYTWVDIDRDGVQDAAETGLGGLTVEVTFLGADGALGGGDDLVLQTVTAADGSYRVAGLPDGDYTVEVVAGLPAGYAATWDETGAVDEASAVSGLGVGVATPVDHDTADFGYAGTGALGGTVWLERTADGTLDDPTEAGIPGIGIDVTWGGPDGVLGTADDVVIRAVTGPGGVWLVEGMPPGPFVATVDPTTLPPGTSVVWDRESGLTSPDGVLTGALAPGERRLDIDTGVQGTSSIGDLVWVDANRNGTRDASDPVAPNVRVVVTWHGADGALGGGDDVVVEVRTGTNGVYLADGLPAGRYTVTFDRTTFPRTTTAYADLDGGDPLVTTVDLALDQDRVDVDLVLRLPAPLAVTGAAVGLLALLTLLLIGGGVLLRRRAERAIE